MNSDVQSCAGAECGPGNGGEGGGAAGDAAQSPLRRRARLGRGLRCADTDPLPALAPFLHRCCDRYTKCTPKQVLLTQSINRPAASLVLRFRLHASAGLHHDLHNRLTRAGIKSWKHSVFLGQNLVAKQAAGVVAVGDSVAVTATRAAAPNGALLWQKLER